jgi:hypothetical protein
MIDLSKYKITSTVSWSDDLGRHKVVYNSDLLGIQSTFLIPDSMSYDGVLSGTSQDVFDLNFWFLCVQVEQTRKAATPAVEVPESAH